MGVLAALMAIISFSNLKFVDPTSIMGTELTVIAAVVIGGTRITGGYGTLLGTFPRCCLGAVAEQHSGVHGYPILVEQPVHRRGYGRGGGRHLLRRKAPQPS